MFRQPTYHTEVSAMPVSPRRHNAQAKTNPARFSRHSLELPVKHWKACAFVDEPALDDRSLFARQEIHFFAAKILMTAHAWDETMQC